MQFRVTSNLVAARDGFLNEFRTFAHISPDHKKCCLCVIAVEEIKQFRRNRRIRPIVKRKSELARRVCPENRSAKKLRARMPRAVSKCARRGEGSRNRNG